jgi:hypothetical protein
MVAHMVTIWGCMRIGYYKLYHRITGNHSLAHEMMLYIELEVTEVKMSKTSFLTVFAHFWSQMSGHGGS